MKWVVLGAGLLALGGCGVARRAAAVDSAQQAKAACEAQTFKTAVARVQCLNSAVALAAPAAGDSSDLLNVALASRLVLAEKLDRGQITKAEFDLEMARTMSNLISEEQRRNNASASVAAMSRRSDPVTCTTQPMFGNLQTTCR
jgi:hypothetical protein